LILELLDFWHDIFQFGEWLPCALIDWEIFPFNQVELFLLDILFVNYVLDDKESSFGFLLHDLTYRIKILQTFY
jgi:hypothetical protein